MSPTIRGAEPEPNLNDRAGTAWVSVSDQRVRRLARRTSMFDVQRSGGFSFRDSRLPSARIIELEVKARGVSVVGSSSSGPFRDILGFAAMKLLKTALISGGAVVCLAAWWSLVSRYSDTRGYRIIAQAKAGPKTYLLIHVTEGGLLYDVYFREEVDGDPQRTFCVDTDRLSRPSGQLEVGKSIVNVRIDGRNRGGFEMETGTFVNARGYRGYPIENFGTRDRQLKTLYVPLP